MASSPEQPQPAAPDPPGSTPPPEPVPGRITMPGPIGPIQLLQGFPGMPPGMMPGQNPPPVVYVSFSAEINASTTEALIASMAQCANQKVPEVYLLLSTGGGIVMNGMNLYNVLRAMPFKLTTHNVGNIDSIGNPIFLAGETRYASPHATFMFHGVGFDIPPGAGMRIEEKFLRERLDSIAADHKRIGAILTEHSALTTRQVAALFREATTKDAEWATGVGIVHEIREFKIPAGAPIVSLVFQRKGV